MSTKESLKKSLSKLIDFCIDNRIGPFSPASMERFWKSFDKKYPEIAKKFLPPVD